MTAALGRILARLTRCPCRTMPYLDHRTRRHHIRNSAP